MIFLELETPRKIFALLYLHVASPVDSHTFNFQLHITTSRDMFGWTDD